MKTALLALLALTLSGCVCCHSCANNTPDAQEPLSVASGYSGVVGVPKLKERRIDAVAFPCGRPVKLKVATRTADGGMNGAIYFRELTIAPDGRILSISAETDAQGITTDQ